MKPRLDGRGPKATPGDPAGVGPRGPPEERDSEIVMRQLIFAAALLVAGCGGSPDFACDLVQTSGGVKSHGCTEIDEIDSSQIDAAASSCTELGGVVVDSCSSDGDLGTCSSTRGGITIDIHFYSEGGATAAVAEEACKRLEGTWTAS
jgi:hypothetical protein